MLYCITGALSIYQTTTSYNIIQRVQESGSHVKRRVPDVRVTACSALLGGSGFSMAVREYCAYRNRTAVSS
jgi:hypothetical protein